MKPSLLEEVSDQRNPAKVGAPVSASAGSGLSMDTKASPPAEEEVIVFPATAAQRRFWLLDQLVPGGNPALNVVLALRLRGDLNVSALEGAFQEVMRRHESLRTTFHSEKGQLLQVISSHVVFRMPRVDVADFPVDERVAVPLHLMTEEAQRPFDLAAGPLLRARLVRIAPREHLLIFPTHHSVADGWSNGVLTRELGTLYAAFVRGEASPLPELAIQFADFSQWQTGRLESGGFDAQLAYWRAKLAGELPVLDLPTDRPRPPWRGQSAPAEIQVRPLDASLATALKNLATREGCSPFMVFLAVFAALLRRYTGGQEDLVIATSTANRQRLEVEGLIGLFVNPLFLRLDLSGEPTFREWLTRVRKVVLEAFEHADAPFEKLVEELQPRRLQVNFLYQQDFLQADQWADLEVTPVEAGSGGAVYEWNLLVLEDGAGIRLHCEYNAELFDASTVQRLLADYEGVLSAVASETTLDAPVARLPLASGDSQSSEAPAILAEPWRLSDATLAWMSDHLAPALTVDRSRRQPLAGHRLSVLSSDGQPIPVGVPGELYVAGSGENATPYRTGDSAYRRVDGAIQWIGPLGSDRKVNGLRVDPMAIERALNTHPHVRKTVVLWHNDDHRQPLLTAYYEGDGAPEALLSAEQMRAFLQEALPEEWIPSAYVSLGEFPLTIDGRLDEAALPTPVLYSAWNPAETHDSPYLPLHHQIIAIWREILNVRSVNIRDDFFALGGNSLLAMRMLYRLEQTFGKTVLPATLFQKATVEHLADDILKHDGEIGSREIVRIQEGGAKTPIFYLHGDIAGGGFYCAKFSRDLGADQPFYALPPVEVDNPLEDRPTIEGMAAAHVETIRSVRPHGPYIIGGFCVGGLIAYEVACQLERLGEKVERLLVIDAGPHDRRLTKLRRNAERLARLRGWDTNHQLYYFCRWHYWLARWDRFRGLDTRAQGSALLRRVGKLFRRQAPAVADPTVSLHEDAPTAWFDARLDVPLVFLWALGGYCAKPYGGAMSLLLSSDLIGGAEGGNPAPAWRRLVSKLDVIELVGNHLACITEHVTGLAENVRRCLERGQ